MKKHEAGMSAIAASCQMPRLQETGCHVLPPMPRIRSCMVLIALLNNFSCPFSLHPSIHSTWMAALASPELTCAQPRTV